MSEVAKPIERQPNLSGTPKKLVTQWFLSGQISENEPIRQFRIHDSVFTVGRKSDSSLCLPVGCISKEHAKIEKCNDSLRLTDLGSTNGTYINGTRLEDQAFLNNGDLIQFATIVFRVGLEQRQTDCRTIQEDACDHALAMMQFDRLINDGGFLPHFQPIVRLEDQLRIGFEVLGRSRLFGLQSPNEMFFAASQLNLEAKLSEVFRHRGIEIGLALGPETNLFVNTHPKELDKDDLYDSLKRLRDIDPRQTITLEIHETAATNLAMMKRLQSILNDLNIRLAFDDFGVGQARLVELGEVRPDFLKFDMKLTKNINDAPPKRQEVVALFANLVNNLGIQSLAEGVENQECHNILVQMGFRLGQGYFYGKPAAISKYLNKDTDSVN